MKWIALREQLDTLLKDHADVEVDIVDLDLSPEGDNEFSLEQLDYGGTLVTVITNEG